MGGRLEGWRSSPNKALKLDSAREESVTGSSWNEEL